MLARFSRLLTFTATAALALASCTPEAPVQPIRADVVADTGGPPPSNDNRDSARFIPFVPFFDSTDVTNATVEAGEPSTFCHDSLAPPTHTVWYFYQSQASGTVQLTAQLFGPAPGILAVYFDSTGLGLLPVGCNSNFGPVTFNADSNSVFFFQISDSAGATGPTVFTLQQDTIGPPPPPPPPPANDNFADARLVGAIPFSDSTDFTNATREPSEPGFCFFQSRTVWYAFTSPTTQAVVVGTQSPFFNGITVFTGSSLDNLSPQYCSGGAFSFQAVAGVTYYIQVGSDQPGTAVFFLQPPPPPQANFFTQPFDPSTFDVVQFYDQSYDPGGVGIQSWQWSFGDGGTANTPYPTHRYAADGDYQVRLTVTTYDGRSGSITRVVQVRTHDVAITKFAVPTAANSGQTRSITVGITSNRSAELVGVALFKSVPGGYEQIGFLQQSVPIRTANRTTNFAFSYTFTASDAVLGKVTFRAVAIIQGGRDALPADNEAIGSPTKVTR
jgi:chitodextrinase